MSKKTLTPKQKEIIQERVENLIEYLLEPFDDEFSYNELYEDLGFRRKPEAAIMRVIEGEVNKSYERYFKK